MIPPSLRCLRRTSAHARTVFVAREERFEGLALGEAEANEALHRRALVRRQLDNGAAAAAGRPSGMAARSPAARHATRHAPGRDHLLSEHGELYVWGRGRGGGRVRGRPAQHWRGGGGGEPG